MIKYWNHPELTALRRMRERFLAGTAGAVSSGWFQYLIIR